MLKTILAKSKYLMLVAVLFSLIASLAAFIWGSVKTVIVILHLASLHGEDPLGAVELISIMDTFLIAAALFIFSVGLYELFIEDVAMTAWLIVHNLHDLKAKLVGVIVLTVTFLTSWRGKIRTARCTSESLSHLFPHHSLRSAISVINIDAV